MPELAMPKDNFDAMTTLAIDTWKRTRGMNDAQASLEWLKVLLRVEAEARREMLDIVTQQAAK